MINKGWFKAKGARFNQYLRQRSLRDCPNIILISLDTLRADHVGCYGYHRDTTPNIDRLAAEGIVFKNAFSTSSWTAPAHMSMLTGLWPTEHGLVQYPNPGVLSKGVPLLAEILWDAGYMTLGFHGGGYMSPHWGFGRGFHVYQTRGRDLKHNLTSCLAWIRKFRNRRLFVFLHGFDCHRPYDPPDGFDCFSTGLTSSYTVAQLYEKNAPLPQNGEDIEKIIAKYDGNVRFADHMIGKFIGELNGVGLLENSIIVVTADHGDELGEHGYFDHIKSLYDETIRIPLVIRGPMSVDHGSIVERLVSTVDIVPTILNTVHIPSPPGCGGENLVHSIGDNSVGRSRVVYGSTGYQGDFLKNRENLRGHPEMPRPQILHYARNERWKLVCGYDAGGVELYDVCDDPGEQRDVADVYPGKRLELLDGLKRLGCLEWGGFAKSNARGNVANEELKAQLKELGYL